MSILPPALSVKLKEGLTPHQSDEILEKIFNLPGVIDADFSDYTRKTGFREIIVTYRAGDVAAQIKKIPGVESVDVSRTNNGPSAPSP